MAKTGRRGGLLQTVVVVGLLLVMGCLGYFWRHQVLQDGAIAPDTTTASDGPAPAGGAPGVASGVPAKPRSRLGDLSSFRTITQDTLDLVRKGDQPGATARVTDLETAWDDAQARLKPRDPKAWTDLDGKIDKVLRDVRSTSPDAAKEEDALGTLLSALG